MATINRRLSLPPLHAVTELPRPQLALMWVPQVSGNPAIPANSARSHWPGAGYVDWVGTDFYSGFPNFSGLNSYSADINGEHMLVLSDGAGVPVGLDHDGANGNDHKLLKGTLAPQRRLGAP